MPKKIRIPQDPDQKNSDRAEWAREALDTFRRITHMGGEDYPEVLTDLLADLGHFADRENLKFRDCLRRAQGHYDEETGTDGKQFKRIVVFHKKISLRF